MSRSGVAPSLYAAKQVKHLLNEVYQIWKRIEELASQGNYDQVILDLQTAFTALETAVSDLQDELLPVQTDVGAHSTSISALELAITSVLSTISSLSAQVATYTGDINTLQSQMATTITQLDANTATISAVATQTATNTASINTLNTFRTTTNSRLNALESDVNNLQSDVNNLQSDLAAAIHATPKQFDLEVGRVGLTGTSLTNGQIILIPFADLPADMPTDFPSLLIIGTFVSTTAIANSQIQIGDMHQIHHFAYNGSTDNTWYGFQMRKQIAQTAEYKLVLGDGCTLVDRLTGTAAQRATQVLLDWNDGYLILSFVYWPL